METPNEKVVERGLNDAWRSFRRSLSRYNEGVSRPKSAPHFPNSTFIAILISVARRQNLTPSFPWIAPGFLTFKKKSLSRLQSSLHFPRPDPDQGRQAQSKHEGLIRLVGW